MARILIGFELGGGLGHVSGIAELAAALKSRGHDVIVALRDLRMALPVVADTDFVLAQAPYVPPPRKEQVVGFQTHTMADILQLWGYADAVFLRTIVRAWASLIEAVAADLVLCEFAPSLALAAYGRTPYATMAVGGFMAPPVEATFRPMRPWQAAPPPASLAHEARLLEAIRAVQAWRGLPCPEHASELFGGAEVFVCTIPELDPYAAHRGRRQLGTLALGPPPTALPAGQSREGIFLYLAADHPGLRPMLAAIDRGGFPGSAYVRGAGDIDKLAKTSLATNRRFGLLSRPAPLHEVLPRAALFIHHAGHGSTVEALRAGVPQLLLPFVLEQSLTATAVKRLGCGDLLGHEKTADSAAVQTMLGNLMAARTITAAEAWSRRLEDRWRLTPATVIAERCERLVRAHG